MRRLASIFLIVFSGTAILYGCSDDDSDPKNLFSSWEEEGSSIVMDLSGGDFGTFIMVWDIPPFGELCTSEIYMAGVPSFWGGDYI